MEECQNIERLQTHIPGLDLIANGGLPKGRSTLVAGSSGSAKTVFATQFLAAGIIENGESGVFITFEESPEDIRRNVKGFGWDIEQWEAGGQWTFVDASPDAEQESMIVGEYDFGALLARIEYSVRKVGAVRLAMDSIGAIFTQFSDQATVRRELFRIIASLRKIGITTVLTAERTKEYGKIARFDVEEFVADSVIILRNSLEQEKRRRTIEILKFRGTFHQKGEWPFSVSSGRGIVVLPISAIELTQKSSDYRVFTGNEDLDRMCGGGFFRDSIILVSGATGSGKTLLATKFLSGGVARGERCLMLAFEESRSQLIRNSLGWGDDFVAMEHEGKLKIVCTYPEIAGLEEHLIEIKSVIEDFQPDRLAIDSLSTLERVATTKGYREFIVGLTSFIKHQEITGLFTVTTPTVLGGTSITESHISTITDTIILIRYVEIYGDIRRGLVVLKMRGSRHEKEIREFTIDSEGMHIGMPFRGISGILGGEPKQANIDEIEKLERLFKKE